MILKTLVDGQGNYDGIDILAGDEIQLKTVKNLSVPEEALKFLGEEEWYQQETLKVSAVVSRPLAKVETFIGDDGETAVDIIMTKEQMEKNFGISDDKTVSISVDKNADTSQISKKLREITADVNQCIVKDYSQQIEAQNLYLAQKMFFYYGISAVLMAISLLHIINSMQYLKRGRPIWSVFRIGGEYALSGRTKNSILFYGSCLSVSASERISFVVCVCWYFSHKYFIVYDCDAKGR